MQCSNLRSNGKWYWPFCDQCHSSFCAEASQRLPPCGLGLRSPATFQVSVTTTATVDPTFWKLPMSILWRNWGIFLKPQPPFLDLGCCIITSTVQRLATLGVKAPQSSFFAGCAVAEWNETPTPTYKAKIWTKIWPPNCRICLVLKRLGSYFVQIFVHTFALYVGGGGH